MTFLNNFIVVVKCNNNILREKEGYVTLPFGAEYSILLKNMDSRKAVVNIDIDGKNVVGNGRLIVQPNSDLELKGVKNNSTVTNKFKFIQKTKEITEYRGDNIEDGLIRVEVTFEEIIKNINYEGYPYQRSIWNIVYNSTPMYSPLKGSTSDSTIGVPYTLTNNCNTQYYNQGGMVDNNSMCSLGDSIKETIIPLKDEGITVKGSKTTQDFVTGYTNSLEASSTVIVIKLKGTNSKNKIVVKPITTKTKLICETCGKKCKSSNTFCSRCGTYL